MSANLNGPNLGIVTDRNDPLRVGRVRVRVPGVNEPDSAWAWPVGCAGGGRAGYGEHAVPQAGATVVVWYLGGDPDRPIYMPGPWPLRERGEDGAEAPVAGALTGLDRAAVPADVRGVETRRWLLTMDDDADVARLEHKDSGSYVEWNGQTRTLTVSMETAVRIQALGWVDLRAARVTLGEKSRVVQPVSDPI